jgi:phage baseplate assembly protein W
MNFNTFTDIDMHFMPNPSSQFKYDGIGAISCSNDSDIIQGINTSFTHMNIYDNLYINNSFIGKIKSIESDNSLTLFKLCMITQSVSTIGYNEIKSDNITFNENNKTIKTHTNSIHSLYGNQTTDIILTTTGFSSGTKIPYKTYNIQKDDLYIKDDTDSFYGNIEGDFIITNNTATVQFSFVYNPEYNNYKTMILELIGKSISIHNANFKFSTPADITLIHDASAIKASIKHLILTMNYERPFDSSIGSQVNTVLFEPATTMTKIVLERTITNCIQSFEPRAKLIKVDINIVLDSVEITIIFSIINTNTPLSMTLLLDRTR